MGYAGQAEGHALEWRLGKECASRVWKVDSTLALFGVPCAFDVNVCVVACGRVSPGVVANVHPVLSSTASYATNIRGAVNAIYLFVGAQRANIL